MARVNALTHSAMSKKCPSCRSVPYSLCITKHGKVKKRICVARMKLIDKYADPAF